MAYVSSNFTIINLFTNAKKEMRNVYMQNIHVGKVSKSCYQIKVFIRTCVHEKGQGFCFLYSMVNYKMKGICHLQEEIDW